MSKQPVSDEKPVVSFRLSFTLVAWLKKAAAARDMSMNEFVARVLDGVRDSWHLPVMIAEILEEDRKAMGFDEYEYFGHIIARRYNEIRDNGGPGFEKRKNRRRQSDEK